MHRIELTLGFTPDPKDAEICLSFARHEIASRLCSMLSEKDIQYAAKQYRFAPASH